MKKIIWAFLFIPCMVLLASCEQEVTPQQNLDDVHVIIEISAHSDPVKYEMDKKTDRLFVDRFIDSTMRYPVNYGFIPNTLSEDGDPVDVLVITPYPIISGSAIHIRPIALLKMEDEAGLDNKILSVPVSEITMQYDHVKTKDDIDPVLIKQIEDFFINYKKSELNKWVKVHGWEDTTAAQREIIKSSK
ncbi:MAG: inorganic diphosphatase [Taibaiella sp.]|jgi:inorganic pyrophosphatase